MCEREWRYILWHSIVAIRSLSHIRLFVTPWTAACQASLSFTIYQRLLKLMPIESVMPSSYLILCFPLLLLPQSFPASRSFPVSQLFVSGGQSIGVSALASVLPMNIQDLFPLGSTSLISLLSYPAPQFKSINYWPSAFLMVQLLYPYMTTGKTIALTITLSQYFLN